MEKITTEQINKAQENWGNAIVAIGKAHSENSNYKDVAQKSVEILYAYNHGSNQVLFKPTLAKDTPFRKTEEGALSYLIAGNDKFAEDKGFALKPWIKVEFENDEIIISADNALAMGHYKFTDSNGEVTKVEYTFGYVKADDGELKIILQHSSLPFSG